MFILFLILLSGAFLSIDATTRHVPVDYPTIQSALDAVTAGDTVLVDTGIYEEALLAPPVFFVLRGNVTSDTGDYPRPVIDPSSLSNPTGQTCMRQDYGDIVIEDMLFRNRLPMYPHSWDTTGGLYHPSGNVTLRRCVFDSTFNAMWVFSANVTLSHCDFRYNSGAGIRTFSGTVTMTDCDFHSNNVSWAQVSASSNSRVERCHFWGTYGNQSVLNMGGSNIQVRNCVFGPGVAESNERFYFNGSNSVFEDNLIENWSGWQGIFYASVSGQGPLYIRNNVVRNCTSPPGYGFVGFQLGMTSVCDSCFIAFDSNEVVDCAADWGAPGIYAWEGDVRARFNRFARLSPKAVWSRDSLFVMQDNLLYENGVGLEVDSGIFTDARWNWWGDSTGPYHNVRNPNGQGDAILGDAMAFIPWRRDTSFFPNDVSSERHEMLPSAYSLGVYPNPFNPVTKLAFEIDRPQRVTLVIYNLVSQKVRTLADHEFSAGYHEVTFDAADLPTGIYFAQMRAGSVVKTEKMVLLK